MSNVIEPEIATFMGFTVHVYVCELNFQGRGARQKPPDPTLASDFTFSLETILGMGFPIRVSIFKLVKFKLRQR